MSCSSADCEDIDIGSSHTLTFDEAQDLAGNFLNDGSATYSLADLDGEVVGTGTLSYVAASDGKYVGVIPADQTSSLTENQFYNVTMVFVQDAIQITRRLFRQAVYGGET